MIIKKTNDIGRKGNGEDRSLRHGACLLLLCGMVVAAFFSCAKMGSPDGGWFDEEPPHIVSCSPEDKGVNVKSKKISILFDEYIKLENATEKVVISPPQMEMPEIKGAGKRISVNLLDSLKENTTYTIDFSDAISDNNEGNPLGNYTYSFSTGDHIDTMEVAGYVVEAENLEPVKGILVGLYANMADSAFHHEPMLRVSRTDGRGHFVIKGIANGSYRIFALQDADGDYVFNQKSEMIAFNHDTIVTSSKPDIRQDTIWRDSLHIRTINRVPYTHFLPDDIVLRAFQEVQTDRYLLKSERAKANQIGLYFSYGDSILPTLRGLNFDDKDAFVVEHTEKKDSITYWIRDSLLINQDTLNVELTYHVTDSTGSLVLQTDTLTLLSKEPYEKRMKQKEKEYNDWKKQQAKAEKRGEPVQKEMPATFLTPQYQAPAEMDPDRNITITMPVPIEKPDTAMIHLYSKHDTLWYNAPFLFREKKGKPHTYELLGEWRPEMEYSLEIDSAAFRDIYGNVSKAHKQGFKVKSIDSYSSLLMNVTGYKGKRIVAQLINGSDKVVKETSTDNGTIEFFYVNPGTYYLRMFEDNNGNGKWDTGNYDADLQPEAVYYYPDKIECKEKWDVTLTWMIRKSNNGQLKPAAIVKQKGDKQKIIKSRNLERAKKLGIEYLQQKM